MKKDIADKWVKALRSGKYGQTRGILKDSLGYCCMGVLCDISNEPEKNWLGDGLFNTNIREWAGMGSRRGHYGGNESLVTLNDSGGSFKEIADIIEKHWKKL